MFYLCVRCKQSEGVIIQTTNYKPDGTPYYSKVCRECKRKINHLSKNHISFDEKNYRAMHGILEKKDWDRRAKEVISDITRKWQSKT